MVWRRLTERYRSLRLTERYTVCIWLDWWAWPDLLHDGVWSLGWKFCGVQRHAPGAFHVWSVRLWPFILLRVRGA